MSEKPIDDYLLEIKKEMNQKSEIENLKYRNLWLQGKINNYELKFEWVDKILKDDKIVNKEQLIAKIIRGGYHFESNNPYED